MTVHFKVQYSSDPKNKYNFLRALDKPLRMAQKNETNNSITQIKMISTTSLKKDWFLPTRASPIKSANFILKRELLISMRLNTNSKQLEWDKLHRTVLKLRWAHLVFTGLLFFLVFKAHNCSMGGSVVTHPLVWNLGWCLYQESQG